MSPVNCQTKAIIYRITNRFLFPIAEWLASGDAADSIDESSLLTTTGESALWPCNKQIGYDFL